MSTTNRRKMGNKNDECSQRIKFYKNTRHGPSDRIRTCGILLPKQARYQLRYTRIQGLLYRKRKENATEIFESLSGIAKEVVGWYNGRKKKGKCAYGAKKRT